MFNNSLPKLLKVIITVIVVFTLASRLRCDKTSKGRVSFLSDAATGEEFSEVIQRRSRSVNKPPQEDWPVGHLPEVPLSLAAAKDTSKFLDLWETRLFAMEKEFKRPLPQVPNIILIMTSEEMSKLIPDEKMNPLYLPKYQKDADNFILDSLCSDKTLWNDHSLRSLKGQLRNTMNGKTLIFKYNKFTRVQTVNGVKIVSREVRPDRTQVLILNNYLFGYENIIKKALVDVENSGGENINTIRMLIGKLCSPSFPEIPKFAAGEVVRPSNSSNGEDKTPVGADKTPVGGEKASLGAGKFLHVWEYHITQTKSKKRDNSTCQFAPEYEVSTIVAVDSEKMSSSLPYQQSEHPLYLKDHEELTDRFILDSISADAVDLNDTNLSYPEGISIHALSGVELTFRKDNSSGNLSVNGETVLKMKSGMNGQAIFVIDNFLFNHLEETIFAHILVLREEEEDSTKYYD